MGTEVYLLLFLKSLRILTFLISTIVLTQNYIGCSEVQIVKLWCWCQLPELCDFGHVT